MIDFFNLTDLKYAFPSQAEFIILFQINNINN